MEAPKTMTETSQKSRLADATIWVARATRFVTAFARALFPHRKMALEVPARFCDRYAWTW